MDGVLLMLQCGLYKDSYQLLFLCVCSKQDLTKASDKESEGILIEDKSGGHVWMKEEMNASVLTTVSIFKLSISIITIVFMVALLFFFPNLCLPCVFVSTKYTYWLC